IHALNFQSVVTRLNSMPLRRTSNSPSSLLSSPSSSTKFATPMSRLLRRKSRNALPLTARSRFITPLLPPFMPLVIFLDLVACGANEFDRLHTSLATPVVTPSLLSLTILRLAWRPWKSDGSYYFFHLSIGERIFHAH